MVTNHISPVFCVNIHCTFGVWVLDCTMLLQIIRQNRSELNTRSSLAPQWQSSHLSKISIQCSPRCMYCCRRAFSTRLLYLVLLIVLHLLGPRQFNCTGLIFLRWTESFTRHSIYEYININELEIEGGDTRALTRCSLEVAVPSNLLSSSVKSLSGDTDNWLNTNKLMVATSSGQRVNAIECPLFLYQIFRLTQKMFIRIFVANWEFTQNWRLI